MVETEAIGSKTVITIAATVVVAVLGYIAKYLNDLHLSRRKERLDRIKSARADHLFGFLKFFELTFQSSRIERICHDDCCSIRMRLRGSVVHGSDCGV
jgi:hypothetical protein